MSTKKLFAVLTLIVIASLALTACAVASPSEAQVACGDAGVKSYNADGFECNSTMSATTEAPAESTQVSAPTAAAPTMTAQPVQPEGCHVIHESVLVESMDHVSTSGDFIHVEYWFNGQPERETILYASKADGGAYNFSRPLKGWVWEYVGCSYDQVLAQVNAHIEGRLAGHFNNVGYFPYGVPLSGDDKDAVWDPTKLFVPAK